MRVLVFQHVAHEGPAAIADWASARGHSTTVVRVDLDGVPIERDPDLLVVLGGPMGVHDESEHSWLTDEKRYLRRALERAAQGSSAVIGVCLGAQLIADVLGAEVTRNPDVEIGWYPVRRVSDGSGTDVLSVIPDGLDVLHWHGDTFGIPDGAEWVLRSEACENQAFEAAGGRVVGLQFHLEQTPTSLRVMAAGNASELVEGEIYVQSEESILRPDAPYDQCQRALRAILDGMERRVV